ncbi:hypothetical protein WR25_22220 [Diploscapter pachys]|uniref:Uncharacterized protein n=1 Tax=Diploscapter pachys TaxID=2018661 RepID=A0A2A2KRX3_9BILA|nr:hypothetical protein WR25_22220 [Diploscapter pachys]
MLARRLLIFSRQFVNFTPVIRRQFADSASQTKTVKFISGNKEFIGKGKVGDTLLDVVVNNDLDLDGFGACEGTLACCTCHVILNEKHFEREDRTNPAGEEELDLLDLAPEVSDRSRLGCQIKIMEDDPEVIEVRVPSVTKDQRSA